MLVMFIDHRFVVSIFLSIEYNLHLSLETRGLPMKLIEYSLLNKGTTFLETTECQPHGKDFTHTQTHTHTYIYMCVCMCVYIHVYI